MAKTNIQYLTTSQANLQVWSQGDIYYDTTLSSYRRYTGSAWEDDFNIIYNSTIIADGSDVYATPTTKQLRASITFVGKNYPTALRQQDVWIKKVGTPTTQATSAVSGTGFTANWLAPTFTNQDAASENEPINRYRVQIDDNSGFSSPTTYTTTSLSYIFTSLTTATYYVRVRAERDVIGGYDYSDWSSTATQAIVSDPILALSPLYYLNREAAYADSGSAGGSWTGVGTISTDANGYALTSSSNAYIHRALASALDLSSTGTEQFVAVLWVTMANTTSTTRKIMTLINTMLNASVASLHIAALAGVSDMRIERTNASSNGGTQTGVRDTTMKKIVLEWRSGSLSFSVNNATASTVSKPAAPFSMNNIALGATVNAASASGFVDNPVIKAFAFWRGTVPTALEITDLPNSF